MLYVRKNRDLIQRWVFSNDFGPGGQTMHGSAVPPSTLSGPVKMRDVPERMADRLIVALDVPTPDDAEQLVNQLDGVVSFYKIGLWLLFAEGTDQLIDKIIKRNKKVFLDYNV